MIFTDSQSLAAADRSLVEQLIKQLDTCFAQKLHSVYVSGHKNININDHPQVDLTISAIVTHAFTLADLEQLTLLKNSLLVEFNFVKSIAFDLATIQSVLSATNIQAWAYWIKNESTFIGGTDLNQYFHSFDPKISPELMVDGEYCPLWQRFCDQLVLG